MKRSLLTSAALAALIVGPALAQQTGTNPNVPAATPGAQLPTVTAPGTTASPSVTAIGTEMTAEDLQGMVVYTTKIEDKADAVKTDPVKTGTTLTTTATVAPTTAEIRTLSKAELKAMTDRARNIGEINDLLIGQDGRVRHAIVDVGGFLGIGERPVTLAWQDLKIVRTTEGDIAAFVEISRADLNNMPQYRAPARR